VFVDPLHGGAILDAGGCRHMLERLHPALPFDERFLEPTAPQALLARMLANLAGSYRRLGDRRALTTVLELRSCLPAAGETEVRELALLLAAGGRYREAADRFEALGSDDDELAARRLRARLN
jgi:regulator of sirC expression with transglutaminase-like and TPR domain